jgi:hypothetical protein
MKSETIDVQQLFKDRRQYQVPFYQRSYVWNREEQWEPLWADIQEKADGRLTGEDNPTRHFLGAVVLEPQQSEGLIGVDTRHIIDGQQRLTTLQYFLAALLMHIKDLGSHPLQFVVQTCLWNANEETMNNPAIEKYKIYPTFRDRENYVLAMNANSQEELRDRFPASFTLRGSLRKKGIRHPPALESIWFFYEAIYEWLQENSNETSAENLLSTICNAVLSDMGVVSISLEKDDDAQVIFETLNGRGAELHATDLIRNFIFMRADREDADSANLYERFWVPFEAEFWSVGQRRGRINKPRLEWFVQATVQAETGDEVDIGRLYGGYKNYVSDGGVVISGEQQLETLSEYSALYEELLLGDGGSPLAEFGRVMRHWDPSTSYSLAMVVARSGLPDGEQSKIFGYLMSYFVRRAVCDLTSKSYTNVFLSILKKLSSATITSDAFRNILSSSESKSARWPSDDEFSSAWQNNAFYPGVLDAPRVRSVLEQMENSMRSDKSEETKFSEAGNLDIDHILPTSWFEHWPLGDGTTATPADIERTTYASMTGQELDVRDQLIAERDSLKRKIGNLTLVHYGVNRSMKNFDFNEKRKRFFEESNLHINRELMVTTVWDESMIRKRSEQLLDHALRIWPGPISQVH